MSTSKFDSSSINQNNMHVDCVTEKPSHFLDVPAQQNPSDNASTSNNKSLCRGDSHSLGIYAKFSSPPEASANVVSFYQQSISRKIMLNERVAECLRVRAPDFDKVEIQHTTDNKSSRYHGLVVCSRLWQCPVCARRISEQRRQELTIAVNQSDMHPILITITLRHHKQDALKELLETLTTAWGKFKSGGPWQRMRDEYFWCGDIRALEVTYGKNGWHPHSHILMFTSKPLSSVQVSQLETAMKTRWARIVNRLGGEAGFDYGLDVKTGNEYIADYVAKFGRLPQERNTKFEGNWTVAHELAKAVVKKGRKDSISPFEMLNAYGMTTGAERKQWAARFQEYTEAMKGKKQLFWSRGLKKSLKIAEIRDEDAGEVNLDWLTLATLNEQELKLLMRLPDWRRGEVLDIAKTGDFDLLNRYLEAALVK